MLLKWIPMDNVFPNPRPGIKGRPDADWASLEVAAKVSPRPQSQLSNALTLRG